jgi:hypothetical protein
MTRNGISSDLPYCERGTSMRPDFKQIEFWITILNYYVFIIVKLNNYVVGFVVLNDTFNNIPVYNIMW